MPGSALVVASRVAAGVRRRAVWRARHGARAIERRLVGRLGVFAYHRIADPIHDPWRLSVSPRRFAEQLTMLRELGTIEPLDEALGASAWTRCRRRKPTFAITFDDGYVDNLTEALPLLERHDAPATLFVPTAMLDAQSFWWDVLATLVNEGHLGTKPETKLPPPPYWPARKKPNPKAKQKK